MKGHYVLDTNVLINDPRAIYAFSNSVVVLPLTVTEELDKKKRDVSTGPNARMAARELDRLTEGQRNSDPVTLKNGSTLEFALLPQNWSDQLPCELAEDKADNKILAIAIEYNRRSDLQGKVTLVSNDIVLRLKARQVGISAESYEISNVDVSELYTGVTNLTVSAEEIDELFKNKRLTLQEALFTNQAVVLSDVGNPKHTALAIAKDFSGSQQSTRTIVPVRQDNTLVSGIRPKNKEQQLALNLLLDDSLDLVTLVGKAGTGKTLLALAVALQKVSLVGDGPYNKIVVSRPIMPMGKDLGFLPGDVGEKLRPWMQPIFDNLSILGGTSTDSRSGTAWKSSDTVEMLQRKGILEVEALTYIRGRSIPNVLLIVDEAQNLSPREMKTILTRAGEGTKVILTGDIYQIDNPYLDPLSNGLTYVVEKAKGRQQYGHITMTQGERSPLADWASQAL